MCERRRQEEEGRVTTLYVCFLLQTRGNFYASDKHVTKEVHLCFILYYATQSKQLRVHACVCACVFGLTFFNELVKMQRLLD